MKKHLVLLSILAASSTCAFAVERPDGRLGTDFAGVYGMYMNANNHKTQNSNDLDYTGVGFEINQNLYNSSDIGIDIGIDVGRLSNQNNRDIYDLDDYTYGVSATVFRNGAIAPYFKGSATYEYFKMKYKPNAMTDFDDDTINLGGEIGAECHLLPGWSVTPYVSANLDTNADSDQWSTSIGINTAYWMTARVGMQLGAAYTHESDSNDFLTTLGMAVHY
jgi:hypothetical protein